MAFWREQNLYLGVLGGVWAILFMFSCSTVVQFLGITLLAAVIADQIVKIYDEFFREKVFIRNTERKAVLITGCDSGFGHRLAQRLANMNFRVYAGCLFSDGEGAQLLAKDKQINIVKLDVTNQEDVNKAAKTVSDDLKKSGLKLWSVVNNAGFAIFADIDFTSLEEFRNMHEVNTFGMVSVTKAFLPLLRLAGEGRIVNVASIAGRQTWQGFGGYSMSKRAVVAFSDGLRNEMKCWNISVHTIEPLGYKTNLCDTERIQKGYGSTWENATEEVKESYGKAYFDERCAREQAMVAEHARDLSKSYEVVNDMAEAVAIENPKACYQPCTLNKVMCYFMNFMPYEMIDNLLFSRGFAGLRPRKAPSTL